eukprot:TRINITY_DN1158_c0_g1_i1.p1 TRINITY_DN1158_c0_g1~~TRINITY_DN1158_c0_g1_i1.p1  ORF type:complete len:227 (-),score=60.59 TRINITY_DN1158_c0_g1_i1:38-649(-)
MSDYTTWEDHYLRNREDFLSIEKDLPFKQVPLLIIDGKKLVQTSAIIRYLADKYSLWGGEGEKYEVDCLYESILDAKSKFGMFSWNEISDDPLQNIDYKLYENYFRMEIKRWLPVYEKFLQEKEGYFLNSKKLSLIDYAFFEYVSNLVEYKFNLTEFPFVLKHYNSFKNRPNINKYLNSEQRTPLITKTYVQEVKRTLGLSQN